MSIYIDFEPNRAVRPSFHNMNIDKLHFTVLSVLDILFMNKKCVMLVW